MKKILVLILSLLLCGCSSKNIQKGTYKNDTEDYLNEVWLMILDENQFRLSPSPISSYNVFGSYEIVDNQLILTDSESDNIYHLDIVDENKLQLNSNKSTQTTLILQDDLILELSE